MIALDIKNLNKTFITTSGFFKKRIFKKKVLDNCSIQIKSGEIFGLAGLNGIGKTTMIKIILDLLKPDSGEINIFNVSNQNHVVRKNICYLPEKFLPSQYLTGYEFLDLYLSFFNKKLDKNEANKLAKDIDLDSSVLSQTIKKYSKGMAQKLGLLYCLLSNAKILILDEPMTGLDPKTRVILKKSLKSYAKKGNTIFFSSHILDDIEEICDKMAVLDDGKIKFNGTPQEFREKYQEYTIEKSFLKCIQ